MHQRIPDDCPLDRGRAVADAHRKRYFGLGNEQGVDQRQFDAQPVTSAHIIGLGALFRLEHGQLVFKLLVARQLCRVGAGLAFAQVGLQFVVVFFDPCQVERQVMRHALRQRCQPLRQAGARGELGAYQQFVQPLGSQRIAATTPAQRCQRKTAEAGLWLYQSEQIQMAAFGHWMARLNIHHHTDYVLLLLFAQDRRFEIELQVVVLFAPLLHLGDEVETGVGQEDLFVCQFHQPTFVQPHMVDIPGCTGRLLRHQIRDLVDNRVVDAQRQRGLSVPRSGLHVET